MIALYKKGDGKMEYATCRVTGAVASVHWGTVGEPGWQTTHPCPDAEGFAQGFVERHTTQGYAPWPEAEQYWLIAQVPVKAEDAIEVADSIHRIVDGLDAELRRLGLGYMDGNDFGPMGTTEGMLSLELAAVVVEPQSGCETMRRIITEKFGIVNMRITGRLFREERETVLYPFDDTDASEPEMAHP